VLLVWDQPEKWQDLPSNEIGAVLDCTERISSASKLA